MSYSEILREFIAKGCILCEHPTNNIITIKGLSSEVFDELHNELSPFIIKDYDNSFVASYLGSEIALIKHD